ncbi:hypothetical protein HYU18_04750 [Candidatus Woesearchaeota archaeon]|nr:hypothetical protein [Candidatus Woesearchaeota archaeon]
MRNAVLISVIVFAVVALLTAGAAYAAYNYLSIQSFRHAQPQQQAPQPPQQLSPVASPPVPREVAGVEKTVEILALGFSPAAVKINAGDTVTWINKDSVAHWPASAQHPTHTVYPEAGGCIGSRFDACRGLAEGESFSFTFNREGEWKYHDHVNCCTDSRFFGTVIVGEEGAGEVAKEPPKEAANQAAASVVLKSAPKIAATGTEFSVSWGITGEPGTTSHTAVHYGRQSVPDPKAPSDYPFASHIFCTGSPCKVPNSFSAPITIPDEGTYYYRAHAIVGGENIWSDERTIAVEKAPATTSGGSSYGGGGY